MARNDTINGFYNYPVASTTATTETVLLAPNASGIYAGFPSPEFPLSTTSFPCGLNVAPPPDIAGSLIDGHPFEVLVSGKLTTTATTNFTVNLYNFSQAALTGGPTASSYKGASTSGTGVTKILTGTATAVGTGGASVNFVIRCQFLWDSVSKTLAVASTPVMYQNGAAITLTVSNATVTGLSNISDLNFSPSFTYSATNSPTLVLPEFVINRV